MAARQCHAFHLREILYPSNLLTLVRLLLLPATIRALRRPDDAQRALLLMVLAMLTDAIDGPIARWRGEVSVLGQILDPIVDKLVIDTTAITLLQTRQFPRWMTLLLLFRDVGILLCALLIYWRKAHITISQPVGKVTTLGLTAAVLLYTADGPRSGRPVLLMTLLPFGLSFWQYGQRFLALIADEDVPDRLSGNS